MIDIGSPYAPWRMTNTTNTTYWPPPPTEERIRQIVREEIAEQPFKVDVPDTPPRSA